ncbi:MULTISPECIES: regulatory protein RecX [Deefgea]|uniref:regulatory protein RecX n=1 Tax=Deefgea TaxID=400947 RepID=UPI00194243AA|nr:MULTISPECIES: regulatory protein RecX [Deefgea]MBM9888183.1 regulatory protein RecX [Deefgea sp. CFH1-16]
MNVKTMISIRNKALQLLSRRDHAIHELQTKIAIAFPDTPIEEIKSVLDEFKQLGWVSDERFAEQWVYFRSQRYGPQRLKYELLEKGVASEIINQVLSAISEDEASKAQTVLGKKFPSPPKNIAERSKQLRYLANKGFSLDIVYQVVGEIQPITDEG